MNKNQIARDFNVKYTISVKYQKNQVKPGI